MKENSFVSRNGSAGPSFLGPRGPHGIPLSVIPFGRKKNLISYINANMPPITGQYCGRLLKFSTRSF